MRRRWDPAQPREGPARLVGLVLAVGVGAASAGCATDWEQTSSYGRLQETALEVVSEPPADLYVNGSDAGSTPVSLRLHYRERVAIEERRASYFRTDPLAATVYAIWSLGVTLPIHLLPTDHDSRDRPLGRFEGADFVLELKRPGFEPWKEHVRLSGQPTLRVESTLRPLAEPSAREPELP